MILMATLNCNLVSKTINLTKKIHSKSLATEGSKDLLWIFLVKLMVLETRLQLSGAQGTFSDRRSPQNVVSPQQA